MKTYPHCAGSFSCVVLVLLLAATNICNVTLPRATYTYKTYTHV